MTYSFVRNRVRTEGGGGNFGDKPQRIPDGETAFRVILFDHTVTTGDLQIGHFPPETEVGKVEKCLGITTRTHFINGRPEDCGLFQSCTGEWKGSCEICDDVQALRNGSEDDQARARKMQAQRKAIINMVNMNARPDSDGKYESQPYRIPMTVYNAILDALENPRNAGLNFFGEEGINMYVLYDKTQPPTTMYSVDFDFRESDSKKIELSNQPTDVLAVPFYIPKDMRVLVEKPDLDLTSSAPKPEPETKEPAVKKKVTKKKAVKKKKSAKSTLNIGDSCIADDGEDGIRVTITLINGDVFSVEDEDGNQYECEASDLKRV